LKLRQKILDQNALFLENSCKNRRSVRGGLRSQSPIVL